MQKTRNCFWKTMSNQEEFRFTGGSVMKKLLSLSLALILIVSMMSGVCAAENEGLANAILKAKEKIGVTERYTGFDSNQSTDEAGTSVYHLYWYTEEEPDFQSFTVEINDRGDFLRYRNSAANANTSELHFAALTGQQMKEAARDWLAWMNPDWISELPEEKADIPAWGDPRHHESAVTFYRQVDGLDYCGDYVRVSVNDLTGMIVSMYANWTYERPAYLPTEAISKDEVAELSIATRPDCIDDNKLNLLARLNKIKPITIELGLQTIHENTAKYIRRGYELNVYDENL